jgi:Tol biopolymer transport system component
VLLSTGDGDGNVGNPAISPDGTEAFFIADVDIAPDDTNSSEDLYRCQLTATPSCVAFHPGLVEFPTFIGGSAAMDPLFRPGISANGAFLVVATASSLVAGTDGFDLDIVRIHLSSDTLVNATPDLTIDRQGALENTGALSTNYAVDNLDRVVFLADGGSSGYFPLTNSIVRVTLP